MIFEMADKASVSDGAEAAGEQCSAPPTRVTPMGDRGPCAKCASQPFGNSPTSDNPGRKTEDPMVDSASHLRSLPRGWFLFGLAGVVAFSLPACRKGEPKRSAPLEARM